jgi:putative membrane protein
MKKILALNVILAVAFFVLNGVITQASNQDSFMREAAQSGMAEVMLGNLALQKSQNEQVRSFAQQMVTDHTAANQELTALAASKNVTLPTEVNLKHRNAVNKLNGMSGTEFDRAFMKQMVKDHQAAVKLFQKQSNRDDDAEVKAFAAKNLPTLQMHLQMAQSLEATFRGNSGGGNNNNSNDGNTNSTRDTDRNGRPLNENSNRNMNSNNNMNMNSNSNRNTNRGNTNTNANDNRM